MPAGTPARRTRFHEAPDSPHNAALPSRPGYARLSSDATAVERNTPPTIAENDESANGLGIVAAGAPSARAPDITLSPPVATDPLFTKSPYVSVDNTPDLSHERGGFGNDVGSYDDFRRAVFNHTEPHASTSDFQHYLHTSDAERVRGAPSIKSAYENNFHPAHECGTRRDFYNGRLSWLNMSIIIICLFSTVFSGIFLVLALRAPRYGRWISTSPDASLRPADAILLTSIFAKLVELSFVTCFVAFLGQVLSRRAFMKGHGRGVTLSELSMWRWVVQPGTLITHWETAKYAGLSVLGILSLLSAMLATFYSSAATAVVQPMLKQGLWNDMVMAGRVQTDFANMNYVKGLCKSPIRNDKLQQGASCLQIEHAGQGYHNYQRYLAEWDKLVRHGNGTTDQSARHPGFGLLYENTTISGQWIDVIDTPTISRKHERAINNVSLAIPHAGVFASARDERNKIMQPEELNSEGTYSLIASVPSPVMNVLCANMNRSELAPIVFDTWNDENVNISSWETLRANATTTNDTVVDDIFGWHKKMANGVDYPPVFSRYPMSFNTVMNHTNLAWGRGSIYLLAQGGPSDDGSDMTGVFSLCKMQLSITPMCSTRYNVTGSGGTMEALCEERDKSMRYIESMPNATVVDNVANWRDIGFDWSNALSLNTGLMDANASNSRLLSQLMLQPKNPDPKNLDVDLSKILPSMGEALAVMASCTLLKSMLDAPFVTFWVSGPLIYIDISYPYVLESQTATDTCAELLYANARRATNPVFQSIRESPTVCVGWSRRRFQRLDRCPASCFRHEHLRPNLLPLPSRSRDRLLGTT
jgi:hypothetical protein